MGRSLILQHIIEHPDTWRDDIGSKTIRMNTRGDLVCFKYGADPDFSDPVVQEARGIIIDAKEKRVVCWPFNKFFNVQEPLAAPICWDTARVQEKIDGSLIKMYHYGTFWKFATSSTCNAEDAEVPGYKGRTFWDEIKDADGYRDIPFDALDKGKTYMFELVSPATQVVVRYRRPKLYILGAKDNETGEESLPEIDGIARPKEYPLRSIDECIAAALEMNKESDGGRCSVTQEGFVVVDGDFHRIKVKSPAYVAMGRMAANHVYTPKRIAELYKQGASLQEMADDFPECAHILKYYDWQLSEVRHSIADMMQYARKLYEEYGHDRKAVAEQIKGDGYAWAGFLALKKDVGAEELMGQMSAAKLEHAITPYRR